MFALPPLPRTLPSTLRDLGSEKDSVRVSAITDLVRHAQASEEVRAQAISLLERALRDESPHVRSESATALADLKANDALPQLLVAVEDEHPHVRQMALNALGEIGDERALPRVERALVDARPELRYQAIIAVSRIASDEQRTLNAIVRALTDDDPAVQHIALRVAEEKFTDALPEEHPLVRSAGALLTHSNSDVRVAAAIFVSKVGQKTGTDELLRIARAEARPMPNKEDEAAAVEVCGEINLREAIPTLERRVWGLQGLVRDTCAFHAKIALARMGHARARREILDDLRSRRTAVMSAAIVAAGRARISEAVPILKSFAAGAADSVLVTEALQLLEKGERR